MKKMVFAKQKFCCFELLLAFSTLLQAVMIADVAADDIELDPFLGAQNPCNQKRNAQFLCIDCQTYGFCSQVNGSWVAAEVGKCNGFLFCNEDANGCSYSPQCNMPQRGPQFECQNPGIYPDPYDCKTYHECSALNEDTVHVCANGMGYAVTQGTCSLSKESMECKMRQFKCNKIGQIAAWTSEPNIYYVCLSQNIDGQLVFYPLLYRCPVGHVFADGECVSDAAKLPGVTTIITTPCRKGSLVGDPTDCHLYKRCGESISIKCPIGSRFNEQTEACITGNCLIAE